MKQLSRSEQELASKLPHLFGHRHYPWSKKYFDSVNRFNFLCAANQIGKSTVQIRKCIDWATNKKKWKNLWRTKPTNFLYFYPSKPLATAELMTKWLPELLPQEDMKKDPVFGYSLKYRGGEIDSIIFNSGVTVFFKTYSQDASDLQALTCYAVFCDEELPFSLFNEIRTRLTATQGYFHMCFTATLGQDEWRRTIEPSNESEELFSDALKIQVSMYDCMKYADGSESPWTVERIKQIERECATEAEVQRRVYGKFVVTAGLKYVSFDRSRNMAEEKEIPESWHIYSGVDVGSGGEKNHPAAITFIAVRPDYKKGIVFQGWRGDGIITTSVDILNKHNDLCSYAGRTLYPIIKSYDWSSKDFFNIAVRAGSGFTPADKRRDRGENLLNTLFKAEMLSIMEGDPELGKLVVELSSLSNSTSKTRAVDDFIDSLRYAATAIPWDFDGVQFAVEEMVKKEEFKDTRSAAQVHWDERRAGPMPAHEVDEFDDIFQEWGDLIENR